MRILLSAAGLLLPLAPVSAQELGQRTVSAQEMLQGLERGDPAAEIAGQAEAAAARPFGSAGNPVRVGGPEGARTYFGRLRCPGGGVPSVGARTEAGIGPYGSVIFSYPLACPAASASVAVDLYHEEHVETRAPDGFTLAR